MIDGITASPPVLSIPSSPHTAVKSDAGNSEKTVDDRGERLNNNATLSAPEADSTEGGEPAEQKAVARGDQTAHPPDSLRNEPPGSRVNVLA